MKTIGKLRSTPIVEVLRDFAPLNLLCDRDLEELATGARTVEIKRERTIVGEGLSWPYVGLVETGFVQAVLTDASGREYALFDVKPRELIADLTLIDDGATALRFIAAAAGTRVILLRRDAVRRVCSSSPALAVSLSHLAAKNMRHVLERFADHVARPATSRVCAVLLKYAEHGGELTNAYPSVSDMTQAQIAREAGTVREVVQRVLSALGREGVVRRERGRVVEIDCARLALQTAVLQP